jgi:hypothetical protein
VIIGRALLASAAFAVGVMMPNVLPDAKLHESSALVALQQKCALALMTFGTMVPQFVEPKGSHYVTLGERGEATNKRRGTRNSASEFGTATIVAGLQSILICL